MILKTIILGLVQGFTEFLPISSSGHLALLETLFRIQEPVALAAFLHFGTLLATVIFFRQDILMIVKGIFRRDPTSLKYSLNIIVGSIPVVIFALLFRTIVESTFRDTRIIALLLGITGMTLITTCLFKKGSEPLSWLKAVIIGIGQMVSIFPGISRSGTTISTGMLLKVDRPEAFKFSFLLSLPAVFGANLYEVIKLEQKVELLSVIVGVICSLLTGLVALYILRRLVTRHFHLFGIYCLLISMILLLI